MNKRRSIMRKIKLSLVLVLVLFLLVGCAAITNFFTGTPKTFDQIWKELTPKGKVALAFSIYNKQYQEYKIQAARTNRTETENVILRQKKKLLVDVYPLIQMFDLALVEGKPLDATIEVALIGYLRQLYTKI